MPASPAEVSTNRTAISIVAGVVSLGVTLGLVASLAVRAAEWFPRQEAVAEARAVAGRLRADQAGWASVRQPGAPVEPGPMRLELFCERCPPPAPTDL